MRFTFARLGSALCAIFEMVCAVEAAARVNTATKLTHTPFTENLTEGQSLRGYRMLNGNTITTPNCNLIRTAPYPAELQLFYTYSVEINNNLLLTDMERAIENAVAMELDMCDVEGRPVFKVKTGVRHSFSTSRKCDASVDGNTCIVVNGETAVLLDMDSDATFVRNRAFIGITNGLDDPSFLDGFSNSVVSAEFISEGHASLVETSDLHENMNGRGASYASGVTTTVAVAAASVTILVASMFGYGFMRRSHSHDPSVRHRNRSFRKASPRTIISGSHLGGPTRRQFVRLEDFSASPTSVFTASISPQSDEKETFEGYDAEGQEHNYGFHPAANWSVSDITSDSASLRSGVSRTPSMLERIEEEIEDDEAILVIDEDDRSCNSSCNFSYSEDSTMITDVLSKAGIISEDDRSSYSDEDNRSNDREFDSESEMQSRILDMSDLDACFTVVSDNDNEIFRDLGDLSSQGTEDSFLDSVILDQKMSLEESNESTTVPHLSNASAISIVSLSDVFQMKIVDNSRHGLSIAHGYIESIGYRNDDSRTFAIKNSEPVRPPPDDSPDGSKFDMSVCSEDDEHNLSSFTTAVESNSPRLRDLKIGTEMENLVNDVHVIDDATSSVDSVSRGEMTVEDYYDVSSDNEEQIIFPFLKKSNHIDPNIQDTESTPENEKIATICSRENEDEEPSGIDNSCDDVDKEDQNKIIHTVDSIDEWVSELMKA